MKNFISLSQLKIEVKKAGVNSQKEYNKYRRSNWPSCPYRYYKKEWISWPNLFGRKKIEFISLFKLKIEVKKAGIKTYRDYVKHRKPNWPGCPDQYYKEEWVGWPNLFSREEIEYILLSKLKVEVKKAGIKSRTEYNKHRKPNWPSNPHKYYKKEWISWNNLFGREEIEFISLYRLKIEVRKSGINRSSQYRKHRKSNWPSRPDQYYKKEWISFSNFFDREFISLEQLKIEVKKAGINSQIEYFKHRNPNWPSCPHKYYKKEWISWNNLFGREEIEFISLSQLKIEVRKAGITIVGQYRKHRKPNWPSCPHEYYKKEWISWSDLFGRKKIEFISLSQLKIEVKKAGVNSQRQYRQYKKRRKPNWPSNPDQYYKEEWVSWNNFFDKTLDLKQYVIRKLIA